MDGGRAVAACEGREVVTWLGALNVLVVTIRLVLEVALACHCDAWVSTPHGERCTSPREQPRCELVEGWHPIAFGVETCSRRCGEGSGAS